MNIEAIIDVLHHFKTQPDQNLALHEPCFKGNEWPYVKQCLDTGWVSYLGNYVKEFESRVSAFCQVKEAIATVNGTAALHLSLHALGVKSSDEVLMPSLTFVATANATVYTGATPHFVDVAAHSLGVDPIKLADYLADIAVIRNDLCYNKQTGKRIAALIVMHTFGHPVELDEILEICHRYHIDLVEDAAESLGSYYKGRHTGSFGRISILSFNGNKIITTGGGGAVITNDEALGKRIRHLSTTAKIPHPFLFCHDEVGFNYRLPNLNAAVGCAQLEQLSDYMQRKRRLAQWYQTAFEAIPGVKFFVEPKYAKSNYWLNTLLLEEKHIHQRELLLEQSNARGIMIRPSWEPLHQLDMYKSCPRMRLEATEILAKRIINIPSSVILSERI